MENGLRIRGNSVSDSGRNLGIGAFTANRSFVLNEEGNPTR
ncbi:MAG: hypothetical protein WCO03_02130 [bacterium]